MRTGLEDCGDEILSSEVGLVYVHELQYANGAVFKGQIKQITPSLDGTKSPGKPEQSEDLQNTFTESMSKKQLKTEADMEGDEMDDGTRGVRHGFGVQIWQDGAKYRGMWQDNRAHGKGTFWHADGD